MAPLSPIMNPGLWGWDSSSNSWNRSNYNSADVFNLSFVPVLTNPNYQDTGLSMRTSIFDESTRGGLYLSNTLAASNLRSTMYEVNEPWNTVPFNISMSGT